MFLWLQMPHIQLSLLIEIVSTYLLFTHLAIQPIYWIAGEKGVRIQNPLTKRGHELNTDVEMKITNSQTGLENCIAKISNLGSWNLIGEETLENCLWMRSTSCSLQIWESATSRTLAILAEMPKIRNTRFKKDAIGVSLYHTCPIWCKELAKWRRHWPSFHIHTW